MDQEPAPSALKQALEVPETDKTEISASSQEKKASATDPTPEKTTSDDSTQEVAEKNVRKCVELERLTPTLDEPQSCTGEKKDEGECSRLEKSPGNVESPKGVGTSEPVESAEVRLKPVLEPPEASNPKEISEIPIQSSEPSTEDKLDRVSEVKKEKGSYEFNKPSENRRIVPGSSKKDSDDPPENTPKIVEESLTEESDKPTVKPSPSKSNPEQSSQESNKPKDATKIETIPGLSQTSLEKSPALPVVSSKPPSPQKPQPDSEKDQDEVIALDRPPPPEIPIVDIDLDETSQPENPKSPLATSKSQKPTSPSPEDPIGVSKSLEDETSQASPAKASEDDKIESVTLDSDPEKDEDKHQEPEKTEFVQITQDKQDDNQIENQSLEAEDPFGGDSLASDGVDPMDTDDINERNINFSKLGDAADNLQEAVNATSSKVVQSHQKSAPVSSTTPSTPPEDSPEAEITPETSKKTSDPEEVDEITELPSSEASKPSEKQDKSSDKSKDSEVEVIPLETDDQSTVLPGQDDELCIIPDDMKIMLPPKPFSIPKDSTITSEPSKDTSAPSAKPSESSDSSTASKTPGASDKTKSTEVVPSEITDDVIHLEDESKRSRVMKEIQTPVKQTCKQCKEEKPCKIKVKVGTEEFSICSKRCQNSFMDAHGKATDIPSEGANSKYEKRCASCLLIVETNDERNLSWETMEFCNEECLGKFQTKYGSYCRNCNGTVQPISLGKYCVRFGYDVRQFCCSTCLEEFKKGLKVCSYCQKDISSGTDGFLAPVGDKGQFKDFCTQQCMEKYSRMNSTEPPPPERKACSVCQEEKIVFCEVQIDRGISQAICSDPCFAAFKFVNKVDPDHCATCKKYFQVGNKKSTVVFYNNEAHTFCNKSCLNIFIITNRKIVPCNWCKVKKYNFDMIKKELKSGQVVMMCSLNCLTLYQVSINAVSARRIKCDLCKEFSQAQYHLTMSDATIRNFCSYNCVMKFQAQYTKSPITIPAGEDAPVPTGMPKRTYPGKVQPQLVKKPAEMQSITNIQSLSSIQSLQNKKSIPVISSVASLASMASNGQPTMTQKATTNVVSLNNSTITNPVAVQGQQIIFKQQVITRPTSPVQVHNKMTQCKPLMHTKGVSVKPHPCTKSTQTDEIQKVFVPVPVPIYIPFPVHMFNFPFPVPVPFPLPIPVPIFIPTTRNSAQGIFKELKRIQEKMPSDPFEAELLMMAEMVATEKKKTESDSDSDDHGGNEEEGKENIEGEVKQDAVDGGNFGEDMLQMALTIAGELEEPPVDLEAALTPSTIAATPQVPVDEDSENQGEPRQTRGRKRTVSYKSKSGPNKKGRRSSSTGEMPLMPPPDAQSNTPVKAVEPVEKADANMALKFTFGVNAWRQWVNGKNAELEKNHSAGKKVKFFKTDLLQLTADELNYSLCLFVKEVRKPSGAEYAPDTIYYLCLGIQQYLFENNRIDNIFTDTYYEKFTDCLNDVATKFSVLYNDAQYIVTRVEEEHLWECKQLGAHSPHVLLSTLMFFNTKHFNLTTVEEHMQLSFSHIMKHWKRNPAAQAAAVAGKTPGSRNVLLRFYPPQSALEANSRKKKVYEQQENEENPLRCPVKLYEFYLSKCPESVKTRNDVFYLLPERSCVPDSPVWYSTSALAKDQLVKMLNRVKMVKEINVALWSS